ncbi:MAG: PhnD/SsuA/transferrin family substrate-binding protein [Coriobacteriia bacterium]|nr:PhnD/SsuA/transferrin family substrate-binding protein [Coriobacteriia bacterium]
MNSRTADSPRRPSRSLLALALAVTLMFAAAGSAAIWKAYAWGYGATADDPIAVPLGEPLHLGVARTPGGPAEWITMARVFAHMQRELSRPIVVHYALSSDNQIRMFEAGELDIALMSTLAYLDLENTGLIEPVAIPTIRNRPLDAAVIVVPYDSDAVSIEDLRDMRFAVSPDLAGASFAYWLLDRTGVNPVGFFAETPAGVQDENLARLANGEVDGTSVRISALAHWPENTFQIIEHSPDLGMPPIVVSTSLDAETIVLIRDSLLNAASRGILPEGSAITGFGTPGDTDYDFARELDNIHRGLELEAFGSAHQ